MLPHESLRDDLEGDVTVGLHALPPLMLLRRELGLELLAYGLLNLLTRRRRHHRLPVGLTDVHQHVGVVHRPPPVVAEACTALTHHGCMGAQAGAAHLIAEAIRCVTCAM